MPFVLDSGFQVSESIVTRLRVVRKGSFIRARGAVRAQSGSRPLAIAWFLRASAGAWGYDGFIILGPTLEVPSICPEQPMKPEERDQQAEDVALTRCGVIAPLVCRELGREEFRADCGHASPVPRRIEAGFSPFG